MLACQQLGQTIPAQKTRVRTGSPCTEIVVRTQPCTETRVRTGSPCTEIVRTCRQPLHEIVVRTGNKAAAPATRRLGRIAPACIETRQAASCMGTRRTDHHYAYPPTRDVFSLATNHKLTT